MFHKVPNFPKSSTIFQKFVWFVDGFGTFIEPDKAPRTIYIGTVCNISGTKGFGLVSQSKYLKETTTCNRLVFLFYYKTIYLRTYQEDKTTFLFIASPDASHVKTMTNLITELQPQRKGSISGLIHTKSYVKQICRLYVG